MIYYVIETQTRPDGIINNTMTARQNENSALSLFHERFSKMTMTELYRSVSLLLVDENLNKVDHKIVPTMWKEPEPETAEETEETEIG